MLCCVFVLCILPALGLGCGSVRSFVRSYRWWGGENNKCGTNRASLFLALGSVNKGLFVLAAPIPIGGNVF